MADRTTFPGAPDASRSFKEASPEAFSKVGHDPSATRQLAMIEARTAALKERFSAHFRKYEEVWVAREAIKLALKGMAVPPSPAPEPTFAPQKSPTVNGYMTQARANVRGRAIRRVTLINHVRAKLRNAIVNNANDPYLSRKFQRVADPVDPAPRPKIRRRRS
jgi:hypothetical protein